MEKYHLFAKINVDGNEKYYMFTSDNLYKMLEKIVVLYKNGYSVELFINEEGTSTEIYEHEQGKKEEGIFRLEED